MPVSTANYMNLSSWRLHCFPVKLLFPGFSALSIKYDQPTLTHPNQIHICHQLFQPFMTTKQQGMGVGLSISRTIIEAHGGRIWVESNPTGGTIFKFTLPVVKPEDLTDDE